MDFSQARINYNNEFRGKEVLPKSLCTVDGTFVENISIKDVNGNPNEEYYKSLRKESKVVQTKKQYWDFSLTALSFASISIFSGWTKRVNSIWTFNSDTLFIIG